MLVNYLNFNSNINFVLSLMLFIVKHSNSTQDSQIFLEHSAIEYCNVIGQCLDSKSHTVRKAFEEENFRGLGNFRGENFRGLLTSAAPKDATPPNFAEKTFVNPHKTAKFAKVFSLES